MKREPRRIARECDPCICGDKTTWHGACYKMWDAGAAAMLAEAAKACEDDAKTSIAVARMRRKLLDLPLPTPKAKP